MSLRRARLSWKRKGEEVLDWESEDVVVNEAVAAVVPLGDDDNDGPLAVVEERFVWLLLTPFIIERGSTVEAELTLTLSLPPGPTSELFRQSTIS